MRKVFPKNYSRLKELFCVIFGHQFNAYSSISDNGFILEEEQECDCCGVSLVDRRGYLIRAKQETKP